MAITLIEASEIVSGLTITGKISPNAVRSDILISPYDELVKLYKSGMKEPEELIEKAGLNPVMAALESVKNLNGLSGADWLSILEITSMKHNVGVRMEKLGKKLQRGDDVDSVEIRHIANQFGKGKTGRTALSAIESSQLPFIETGWKPIDTHLGGIPSVGLVVVGGNPSVGKTSFMGRLAISFVKKHPEKRVGLYSLEMILPEIAGRLREISNMSKDTEQRIEVNSDPLQAEEILADASGIDNLGLLVVDFADLMIRGEVTEGKMAEIYRTLAIGSKQLECPVVLLSQLSRSYKGGIPRPENIRWTSMAEILAWMLLMLYRPADDFYAEDENSRDQLPVISDVGYIIAWKVRGGFRAHKDDAPGAIQLPFDGEKGWSIGSGKWFSLKNL